MSPSERYYQDWVNERNKVLEDIFRYHRLAIADRFRFTFDQMVREFLVRGTHAHVDNMISHCAVDVGRSVLEMRQDIHSFTYAASLELMAGIFGKKISATPPRLGPAEMLSGGHVEFRVVFYLNLIARKMQSVTERQALAKEPLGIKDLARCLPKAMQIENARKGLRKLTLKGKEPHLKEANQTPEMSTTFMTDNQWDSILAKYQQDYMSPYRGPDFIVGQDLDGEHIYAWEFERDLTDSFVKEVQDGQHEAYTKAGVKKFVWIAVLDNKTCEECCVWRDGLTTDEIARQLKKSRKKAVCQGTVPPAHLNCRCTLAPALDSLPDKPAVRWKQFDEWLAS